MNSGLLLCSSRRGKNPFIIGEGEGELWSLEELAYYLYQNAYRITEEFFSPELEEYLAQELEQRELAERLSDGKSKGWGFVRLIMEVCLAANYYDSEELKELECRLESFSSLDPTERLKYLADSYMNQKKYMRALKEYERILSSKEKDSCGALLLGKVYHNMGIAYGRNFLYQEAEEYLRHACELFQALDMEELVKTVKNELLLLYELSGNKEKNEQILAGLTEEEQETVRTGWEKIRKSAVLEKGKSETLIEMWKQEYRTQMS